MKESREKIKSAFTELLREKPFGKITVNDIVGYCGMHRNTFYYHFTDMAALLEEIVSQELGKLMENAWNCESPVDCLMPVISYGLAHKKQIRHIYYSTGREIIHNALNAICEKYIRDYIAQRLTGFHLKEDEIRLLVNYYRAVVVGIAITWLDSGMKYDLEDSFRKMAELLYRVYGMNSTFLGKNTGMQGTVPPGSGMTATAAADQKRPDRNTA